MEESKRIKLVFELPLRNRNKEIIAYTKVDEDDYEKFKDLRLCRSNTGYAQTTNKLFHQLIMPVSKGLVIDHINGDKLDNRKENLRLVTRQENARNKNKVVGATSHYYGVTRHVENKKWKAYVRVNGKLKTAHFIKEDHAAYWRDVLVKKYNLIGCKLNDLEKPYDFIEPSTKEKQLESITITKYGKYMARITHCGSYAYLGVYNTAEEAKAAYINKKNELEQQLKNKILNEPIKRNQDGVAVIELFNRKKEKIAETTVNDETYYDLMQYKWCHSAGNYVSGRINGDMITMHRFLMNAKPDDVIDHINNNRLDNRLENLRFSNHVMNAHNRSKLKNTASNFKGCRFYKKRFIAEIKKDGKYYYLGRFKNEIDAAKAYDVKAKELYGEYANLNFN